MRPGKEHGLQEPGGELPPLQGATHSHKPKENSLSNMLWKQVRHRGARYKRDNRLGCRGVCKVRVCLEAGRCMIVMGHTAMGMYLVSLNCALKMINFI